MSDTQSTVSYATLADLDESGLAGDAISSQPLTVRQKALLRASRFADTFLRNRYSLPVSCPFDQSLIHAVVQIATFYLMARRGVRAGQDFDLLRMSYDDAVNFLRAISNGQAQLCIAQASPVSDQPALGTNSPRDYSPPSIGTSAPVWGSGGFGL